SLHRPAPAEAPNNSLRGVPLHQRADAMEERMLRLKACASVITPRVMQVWNQALEAPLDGAPTWLHGDLHPRNVLVDDGVISGIIDWGDITSGDCATDLASTWMLFGEPHAQREALEEYGEVSEATVPRAKRCASFFGV